MKAFIIFPTICVFIVTLTFLILNGLSRVRIIFWSTLMTAIWGGFMAWLSFEVFTFLYYSNFLGVLVCIPCLTYLSNRLFPDNSNKRMVWMRLVGLGVLSTVVTIATAGFLILVSFINNPMDPPMNKQQTENQSD
ncbi:hypothetical protein AHMF7605_17045 [Adhaeribacter arboris]|uniref:Uncharacterized protein n=1 Tax=Adhaeribacter arboris TaxID=2072846 RepID=A0A2T2YHY8_9BACT|nr:hypothetical protein AHMF7605_17045 [Adhaeribacter arboris]